MAGMSADAAKGAPMIAANERARVMLLELAAPLMNWNETKESVRATLARRVGLSARRVRSILGREKIRLGADEYLQIAHAYRKATHALEEISDLAGEADLRAHRLAIRPPAPPEGPR
jgi:hypothetical protein